MEEKSVPQLLRRL